jgi:amino-acid N-acetyltransferase
MQPQIKEVSSLTELRSLLQSQNLPDSDLTSDLSWFMGAYDDSGLVGSVGLEVYDHCALLRSLAVKDSQKNSGIGGELTGKIIEKAKEKGIREIYLITNTAEKYFEKKGFLKIERNEVPQEIRETQQFSAICPSSASVMKLGI